MNVEIIYRDSIRVRFLMETLPSELRESVDKTKRELWKIATESKGKPSPILEKFFKGGDRVYSVKFTLGKIRQDSPEDQPVQQLLILQIRAVEGLNPIS
jgi:hypothetical protein